MKRLVVTTVSLAIALSGCATASKDIASADVSPLQYNPYDCTQLQAEAVRISGRVSQLGGRLDEAANNDKVIMGVGMILFWPALFALGGTKAQEAEYARLKGEHDAVQRAMIEKKCAVPTAPVTASAPAPADAGTPPAPTADATATPLTAPVPAPATVPEPAPAKKFEMPAAGISS